MKDLDLLEQIASGLGLQHPDDFRAASKQASGSGRTTRMLLWAIVAISKGEEVCFVAHTLDYARELTERARQMAHRLDIDPRRIRLPIASGTPVRLWPRGVRVLEDHSVWI